MAAGVHVPTGIRPGPPYRPAPTQRDTHSVHMAPGHPRYRPEPVGINPPSDQRGYHPAAAHTNPPLHEEVVGSNPATPTEKRVSTQVGTRFRVCGVCGPSQRPSG
ncbi:hypothetical protein GCM10009834_45090 [Streptomonospora arabica]